MRAENIGPLVESKTLRAVVSGERETEREREYGKRAARKEKMSERACGNLLRLRADSLRISRGLGTDGERENWRLREGLYLLYASGKMCGLFNDQMLFGCRY